MTQSLLTRLSKLDAPDREVDAEICILFQYGGHNSEGATNVRTDPDWDGDLLFEIGNEDCCNPIPKLTLSIDAVIALTKRVLPELSPQVGRNVHHKYWHASVCRINDNMADGIEYYDATHDVAAIALCIALLRAKEAST